MSGSFHAFLSVLRKIVFKLLLLLATILIGGILYANLFGIPKLLLNHLLEKVNQGSVAVIVDSAVLRGVTHVHLNGLELYRKHVLGKPLFSAASVQVDFSAAGWLRGESAISSVLVEGAVLIPKQGRGDQLHSEAVLQKDLSFPVVIKNSSFHDLVFKQLEFNLIVSGGIIDLCDLKASVSRDELAGRVTGEMSYDIELSKIYGELITHLNPHAVMTFFSEYNIPYAGKLISRFGFRGEKPRVKWVFYYYAQRNGDIYLSGDCRMRNCSYRGIDFSRADGLFSVSRIDGDVEAELSRLFVVGNEGIANVSFVVKPYERLLDFDVKSSLRPMTMARMVGVLTYGLSKNFEFNGASTVEASGILDYGGSHSNTDFRAKIKADQVSVRRLNCESGAFDLKMQGRNVTLTNIEATAYNGTFSGSINLISPHKDVSAMPYSLNLGLHDADFEKFMRGFESSQRKIPYHGRLSMDMMIEGAVGTNSISSMNGSGSMRISDGRVFMMPVFGGLSEFMTKIIPGLDLILKQSNLSSKFTVNNGLISTDKIAVEGDVLSLKAYGGYMLGGELDFDVQVKLMKEHTLGGKVFRFLTYPLSKLFEFKLKGTLDDPHWYPENFSLDLLKKIGIGKEE